MSLLSRLLSYSAKFALARAWGVATYGELCVLLVIPPRVSWSTVPTSATRFNLATASSLGYMGKVSQDNPTAQ